MVISVGFGHIEIYKQASKRISIVIRYQVKSQSRYWLREHGRDGCDLRPKFNTKSKVLEWIQEEDVVEAIVRVGIGKMQTLINVPRKKMRARARRAQEPTRDCQAVAPVIR